MRLGCESYNEDIFQYKRKHICAVGAVVMNADFVDSTRRVRILRRALFWPRQGHLVVPLIAGYARALEEPRNVLALSHHDLSLLYWLLATMTETVVFKEPDGTRISLRVTQDGPKRRAICDLCHEAIAMQSKADLSKMVTHRGSKACQDAQRWQGPGQVCLHIPADRGCD